MNQASYHHGNLKAELIKHALKIINKEGISALTIRKVATAAKVSHTACYRHFINKKALLAAIATQGFELFLEEMQRDTSNKNSSLENLMVSGRGYLRFAQTYAEHYNLMFKLATQIADHEELKKTSEASFNYLLQLIGHCQRDAFIRQGDTHNIALFVWASLHGFCDLNLSDPNSLPSESQDSGESMKVQEINKEELIQMFQQQIYMGLKP